jgi:hypothetical protein
MGWTSHWKLMASREDRSARVPSVITGQNRRRTQLSSGSRPQPPHQPGIDQILTRRAEMDEGGMRLSTQSRSRPVPPSPPEC